MALVAAGLIAGAKADEPAIIAKARAYLGSEEALNAVNSLHLSGTVIGDNLTDPAAKPWLAKVEIIFQRPWQESLLIRYPTQIVHTALDDFEAWQQIQDHTTADQTAINPRHASNLIVLNPIQVRNLRADTWYNLNFYRHVEMADGTVTDDGPVTIEGVSCEKIVFFHSPLIVYTRYFDRSTGRLVFTQTRAGARIRESGEIVVAGIRFPKTIVSSETTAKGRVVSSTYTFDRVVVNEVFPADFFAVPVLPLSDDTEPYFPTSGKP